MGSKTVNETFLVIFKDCDAHLNLHQKMAEHKKKSLKRRKYLGEKKTRRMASGNKVCKGVVAVVSA